MLARSSLLAARRWITTGLPSGSTSVLPQLGGSVAQACPSLDEFKTNLCGEAPKPMLLRGLVKPNGSSNPYAWPAVRNWSNMNDQGLETLSGMRNGETEEMAVDVEVGLKGRGYMDKGAQWQKITMPFGLFLEAFVNKSIPSGESTKDLIGYVAQQDLFGQAPSLAAACPTLPHPVQGPRGAAEQYRCNLWIGPSDTFTPLHRDPYDNLFVQVVGSKRFHVFPPSAADALYLADEAGSSQKNTSTIPMERFLLREGDEDRKRDYPHLEQWLSSGGQQREQACHTVLDAGDALFLPRGWYHCVSSLSTSASVNFWWR